MFEIVDLYCERLGPGLWAEPFNAVTNAALLIAAWFSWRLAVKRPVNSLAIGVLTGLMVAIGVGSGLFHTFATGWARILDVVPILVFQMVYIWTYCRSVVRLRFWNTAGVLAVFFTVALVGRSFPHVLNGSLMYAPALGVLIALGAYHFVTRKVKPHIILGSAGVFAVSLACRTMDQVVCPHLPLGTHFLWHTFNGIALYLLMRGLLLNLSTGVREVGTVYTS